MTKTWMQTLAAVLLTALLVGGARAAPSEDKIIISGASGQLGELTIKALLARGVPAHNLILVSRTTDSLEEYAKQGAAVRFGDFNKPESLPDAFAGGTRMLLISIGIGGGFTRPFAHKQAIDAAVKAGVKHIVYTSYVAISKGDTVGLASDHYQTEQMLRKSGVKWTFLRNSIYMDGLLVQAEKALIDGYVTVTMPLSSKIGYVTRADCAAVAAAVLTTPGHENKAYDITGPELIGPREIATAATAVTGKPVAVTLGEPNVAPPRPFGGPALEVVSTAVADLTGHRPTSLRELLAANRDKLPQ